MDELLDRLKSIKINRKYLIISLLTVEMLGILTLVWLLRDPLIQKYLTKSPKAYSLAQMDDKKRYVISQGDYLVNQASPNSKIVVLIKNTKEVEEKLKIKPNTEGKWQFQFPPNLTTGIKNIIIGELNPDNKIIMAKNYRIRVVSSNILVDNKLYQTIASFIHNKLINSKK